MVDITHPAPLPAIDPATCPISWHPNALAPVFCGIQDFPIRLTARDYQTRLVVPNPLEAPVPLRIFFPTLDNSPFSASILRGCGRYPLILFAHGNCPADQHQEHFKRWLDLPTELARAGNVVVVPDLPAIRLGAPNPSVPGHPDLQTISSVLAWMREEWIGRDVLLPASATGIIGHSYGGLLSAVFALSGSVAAYASLSAGWAFDWLAPPPLPIQELSIPKLLIYGDRALDDASVADDVWESLSSPKHRIVFVHGQHWDYLPAESSGCGTGGLGRCGNLRFAAADFVTMFFGKYLQPELSSGIPPRIPSSLRPPPLILTSEQESFASNYLTGVTLIEGQADCEYKSDWSTPYDRIVPDVLNSPSQLAAAEVRAANLFPVFKGSTTGTVVSDQDPQGGVRVDAGSTVELTLKKGPLP